MEFTRGKAGVKTQAEKAKEFEQSRPLIDRLVASGLVDESYLASGTDEADRDVEDGKKCLKCEPCECASFQKKYFAANMVFCAVLFAVYLGFTIVARRYFRSCNLGHC
jgi:hypothetical protein